MPIRAVFLDVGETLIDETGAWARWARWLGVPELTLFGVLGAIIERGEDHRRAFEVVRPGIDLEAERRSREAAGDAVDFTVEDFYPDALPCLLALRSNGFLVGLAGNTAVSVEEFLRAHLSTEFLGSSASFGVEKPSPEFFGKISLLAGVPADQIAYVGDRLDNDILPAISAGMVAVHIRRGPWGYLHASKPEIRAAHAHIDSLGDLVTTLRTIRDRN